MEVQSKCSSLMFIIYVCSNNRGRGLKQVKIMHEIQYYRRETALQGAL